MNFLHPVFLGAALAVGIPILIHLSQRRKFKELKIGTLRFLKLAEQKRNLRLRVEQLPLLLLRILAILLLAFLFARPFFSDHQKLESAKDKTIVLLDASGSMTDSMKRAATKAASGIQSDGSSIVFAQFSDGVQILDSLEKYEPIAGAPSDFNKALGWSLDQLRQEGIENAKVVLIGHFAAASLPSVPPRVWPPRISVEAISIEPPSEKNEAIRSLELLTPFATGQMEIEARLTESRKEREVSLAAEGMNLKQKIPANSERVLFSFRPNREEIRGTISVEGNDDWPADDQRPFAVRWAEPESVMIVDGFPGSTPFEGQGYFLQKALAASGAAHGLSPFRPEISFGLESDPGEIARRQFVAPNRTVPTTEKPKVAKDFSAFSAFALCGPTAISANEAVVIQNAVSKGAGLLTVIDGRWTPQATAALVQLGLFPGNVSLTGGMQQRRIASWDKQHPVFAAFSGSESGDLRPMLWRDSFTIIPDKNWNVLATLDGGHPLLLERRSVDPAHGRILVLAHPLNREWTDLPREPIFVPLLKSIFTPLTRYQARETTANVRTPGINESRTIGIHQTQDGRTEVVAADPLESSVTAVDADAFKKAFGLPMITERSAENSPANLGNIADDRPREGEWWQWIVLALLLILTIECALATRRPAAAETSTLLDA